MELPLSVIPEGVRTYRRVRPLEGQYVLPGTSVTGSSPYGAPARPLAVDTSVDNNIRPLVLLIDFADRPASPTVASKTEFESLFFGVGLADLSVSNYWAEVSYGKFAVNGSAADINPGTASPTGWLRAGTDADPTTVDFPTTINSITRIAGVQVGNIRTLIADAVAYLATQGVDFSPYVSSSTGEFFTVILVHPTYGAEDSWPGPPAPMLDPYSHTAGVPAGFAPISTAAGDIVDYTIVPSIQFYNDPTPRGGTSDDPRIGVGVIVHEMGHLLGLPDLYPTTGSQASDDFSGAGVFDLMAYGMWGNNILQQADVPAHLSAWSKMVLGWATPSLRTASSLRSLRPVELFPDVDKIYSNTDADPGQFFLVENREPASSLGTFLFDKGLPGAGILIWQIDNEVIQAKLGSNTVNNDSVNRGVYVKEADGIPHMGLQIPRIDPGTDAPFYGQSSDYFLNPVQVFDRKNPSPEVNSSPVKNVFHPLDFLTRIGLLSFTRSQDGSNRMDYDLIIDAGPSWRTFNVASTQPPKFPAPMRSDDILSIAFDSGNNAWMGSRDEGIFRFLGTEFEFLTSQRGLPSGSGTPVAPIQAMVFEPDTGSMWVGTDRGLYKMRDAGSGFRVQSSTSGSPPGNRVPNTLAPSTNIIRSLAIRGGFSIGSQKIDLKYAATPVGLLRVEDLNNDPAGDDVVGIILAGDVTAVAVDDNGTPGSGIDDILWVGFADGSFTRSLLPAEGGQSENDPRADSDFRTPRYLVSGSPNARISALAVDNTGILWIGTGGDLGQNRRGIQAFDLGEHLDPVVPNLRDPYDFNGDGDKQTEAYLNFNLVADDNNVFASNNITGIGFQTSPSAGPVVWMSQKADNFFPGGVCRFNTNLTNVDTTGNLDERLTVFRPIPPPGEDPFGNTTTVVASAGDSAGNVWFASTDRGVFRFGNAGILSLDKSNYVNISAVATVTLQDDGLNLDPLVVDSGDVQVHSREVGSADILLTLRETGPDTGVFTGTFGFTNGASDNTASLPLIQVVQSGVTVEVTYLDSNPPGERTATATWKKVFPFEDSLLIEGGACFIATAAYGSILVPEVRTLRAFRDRYLLTSDTGKGVVAVYYRYSPPIASVIARRPWMRVVARALLAPLAWAASLAVQTDAAEKGAAALVLFLMLSVVAAFPTERRRSRSRNGEGAG